MILAIDVGNTNILFGCMDGEKVLFTERLSTDTVKTSLEYAILFQAALKLHKSFVEDVEGAVISSVVPPVTPVIQTALRKIIGKGKKTVVLGPGTKTGLSIRIDDPSSVGADLVAGAVGALVKYRPPLVVIDMGTATTLSVVDKDRNYIGGAIMPGLRLNLSSLVSGTSMLGGISLNMPEHAIGHNTADAMLSGLVYGHAAMIDGLLDRMEEEIGRKMTMIATGGLASSVIPVCRHEIILDRTLLLTGMQAIYRKNVSKE